MDIKLLNMSLESLSRKAGRHPDFTYFIILNLSDILWPLESQLAPNKILKHIISAYDNCSGTMNTQICDKVSVF